MNKLVGKKTIPVTSCDPSIQLYPRQYSMSVSSKFKSIY